MVDDVWKTPDGEKEKQFITELENMDRSSGVPPDGPPRNLEFMPIEGSGIVNTSGYPDSIEVFRQKLFDKQKKEADEEAERLRKLDLNSIKKEIDSIKKELENNPASRNSLLISLTKHLIEFAEKSRLKTKTGFGWISNQIKRPYKWVGELARPHILRIAYQMTIDRLGNERSHFYEAIISYQPTALGRWLKFKKIRQGYRRIEGKWTAYPYGAVWSREFADVNPSTVKFLERSYLTDRLYLLSDTVEKAGRL